ncbi:MAG TPA: hypothetical protein VFA63_18515 [Pseudonocardiaceae bacterium]|jgi:hypothetical protein|nr:hypothetical protein [Pseudonocardiaceae bacterium]
MNTKRRTTQMGLVAIAASSALVLGAACGGGGETPRGPQIQPPAAQSGGNTSPGNASGNSCVDASQVLSNMQSYTGKPVTVTGTIGQVVGQNAFTVAIQGNNRGGIPGNNANNAQTLLAVAKQTTGTPTAGSPVQVTGVLQPTFDPNQAQARTGINFDRAALTPYNGKPYVEAAFAGPISVNLTNSGQAGGLLSTSDSNCAAASRVLDNPQSYTNQQITMVGTVGQLVSQHGFTITANTGNNAQTLLAVAKETTDMPIPGSPIQAVGTLQPTFDVNQAAAFAGNLDQTAFSAYNGKPWVQAVYAGPVSANLTGGQGGR